MVAALPRPNSQRRFWMTHGFPGSFIASVSAFLLAIGMAALGPVPATGQTKSAASKRWAPAPTADGHPDLQGIWSNALITPLERPAELADKPTLTEQE